MGDQVHGVGLIGYPAAGKTTAADYLSDEIDHAEHISIGDVVRDILRDEWNEEPSGPDIRDWVTAQLEDDDENVIRRVTQRLDTRDLNPLVVVDGVRTPADVRVLDEFFDHFTCLYLMADDEVRLQRIQDRGRDDEADFDLDDLHERDADEEAWGLDTLVEDEYYDYAVTTHGDVSFARIRGVIETEHTIFQTTDLEPTP